jgi:hypothetical protein
LCLRGVIGLSVPTAKKRIKKNFFNVKMIHYILLSKFFLVPAKNLMASVVTTIR